MLLESFGLNTVRQSFLYWNLFSFFNMVPINRNSFLCHKAQGKARKGQMLMQMSLLQQNKPNGHQGCLFAKLAHWPLWEFLCAGKQIKLRAVMEMKKRDYDGESGN